MSRDSNRPEGAKGFADVAPVTDGPLVSCLMVSRGDPFPAGFAINCYRRQTYRNRELVIVTARRGGPLPEWLARVGDPSIRYFEVDGGTLGDLRNASVAQARGHYVCHWDDDDLYHSGRLAWQVAAVQAAGVEACFLERLLLWWPERRLLRISRPRLWEGSILAERAAMPSYPSLPFAEDTPVTNALRAAHEVATFDRPLAYCYVMHGHNTGDAEHFEEIFYGSAPLSGPDGRLPYPAALQAASAHYPLARYAEGVAARNRTAPPPPPVRPQTAQIVSLGRDTRVARRLSRALGPLRRLHLFDDMVTPHRALVALLEAKFAGFLSPSNLIETGVEDGFRIVTDSSFGVDLPRAFPADAPLKAVLGGVQAKYAMLAGRFLRLRDGPPPVFLRDAGREDGEEEARQLRRLLDGLIGPECLLVWIGDRRATGWSVPGVMTVDLAGAGEAEWDGLLGRLRARIDGVDAPSVSG